MAKRVDDNQREITRGLNSIGISTLSTAPLGHGAPDIVAGGLMPCPHCGVRFRQNLLLEIKDGEKSPSRRKLTPDEQLFHDTWRGQVSIINSLAEALRTIGVTTGEE